MRGYTDLSGGGAVVRLEGAALVRLSGTDAESWLQGQATNDVRLLDQRPFVDACLVKSTGQLEAVLRVWRDRGGLAVAIERPDVLQQRVLDYVILEDVTFEAVSDEVWTWQSPEPVEGGLPSPRTAPFGADFTKRPNGAPEADREAWETACLERGMPVFGSDTDAKTLPPELGTVFESGHVSYDKGCYMGQEVLQRIHSRGHTNKTWAVLRSDEVLAAGSEIAFEGAVVGRVTRACVSPKFGPLAGAVLANRATSIGTTVHCGAVRAEVASPPVSVL